MYAHRDRPQDAISLYSSGGNTFDVRLAGDGSIDHQPIGRDRAYRDYHEGATVLHQGEQYQVVELREDIPQPYISLEKANVSYYTQSQGQVNIYDTVVEDSREVGPFTLNWGMERYLSTIARTSSEKSEAGTCLSWAMKLVCPR